MWPLSFQGIDFMSESTANSLTVAKVLVGPVSWLDGGIGRLVLMSDRRLACQAWNYHTKTWIPDDFSMESLTTMARTATPEELAEAGVLPD
jgi:hypothetical protein